jgi:hypothetical protein
VLPKALFSMKLLLEIKPPVSSNYNIKKATNCLKVTLATL